MIELLEAPVPVVDRVIETSNAKPNSAHIVNKTSKKSGAALTMESRVYGTSVTALCGYVFVVTQSAKDKPLCAECKEIYEADPNGFGDRGELPDE